MDIHRDEYTINPETGRKTKIGSQELHDRRDLHRSDHSWFTSVCDKQGVGWEYRVNEGSKKTKTYNSP